MTQINSIANRPIGVFDSGLGGLTVLKSLEKQLPNESFLYFGDTAHVPYGTKSKETVIRYSRDITRFLISKEVKLIVIACNTASSIALKYLQDNSKIPIIGVVEPVVRESVSNTKSAVVGVIGTRATINSNSYRLMFNSIEPEISIIEKACPLFVPIIEEGWAETETATQVAEIYLKSMLKSNLDTLVLGCTHYPILIPTLKKIIPAHVNLISSGDPVSKTVSEYLKEHNLHSKSDTRYEEFFVTDYPQQFNEIGSRFLGRTLSPVTHVDIS